MIIVVAELERAAVGGGGVFMHQSGRGSLGWEGAQQGRAGASADGDRGNA